MNRAHRTGLTLIEVLVATALAAFLIATATAGFMQMRTLARRVDARQQLHNTARVIFERLNDELSALMQGSAVFAAGKPGAVELVYLRGKLDNTDFTTGSNFGADLPSRTDLLWSRVAWDGSTGRLTLAASRPVRSFFINQKWGTTNTWYFDNRPFTILPTPQRTLAGPVPSSYATTITAAATTLNADVIGCNSSDDKGDYSDLTDNGRPLTNLCSSLAMEFVCEDGSVHAVGDAADSYFAAPGQFIDGRGGAQMLARPRLLRMRIRLAEPVTGVGEDFSFSFLLPGLSPL